MIGLTLLFALIVVAVFYVAATSDDLEPPSSPNSPVRMQLAYARARR